jgi:hypothetical protein
MLTVASPVQAILEIPFRLNNSSVHSSVALTLALQHIGQLSRTRFTDYYSESQPLSFQLLGNMVARTLSYVKKIFLYFSLANSLNEPIKPTRIE